MPTRSGRCWCSRAGSEPAWVIFLAISLYRLQAVLQNDGSLFSNGSRARLRDLSNGFALITVPKAVRKTISKNTTKHSKKKQLSSCCPRRLREREHTPHRYRQDDCSAAEWAAELASRHDAIVTRTNASSELDSLGVPESKSLPGWRGSKQCIPLFWIQEGGMHQSGRMLLMLRFLGARAAAATPCPKARHPRESALRS